MDYNLMMQKALLGVVRDILMHIKTFGLEDEHHLYISFRTNVNGVVIPASLRQKFPEEMTIVLQYQFWDLCVTDEYFSIKLSFSGKPESIKVPFYALTKIFDPSVQFGLQFVPEQSADDSDEIDDSFNEAGSQLDEVVSSVDMSNVVDFAQFKSKLKMRH
ncbi:MAG: ClpXP protease specificity-enhancing factor SspB [Holosporales bacterium]|jgi:hypothetical protein|nr:ClpXP protease specificity-enhancing factor SspB [Holosporales bacterium]